MKKPKQKAGVEGSVGKTATAVIAKPRNETFTSLAALNAGIRKAVKEFNDRPFRKRSGSRSSIFETEKINGKYAMLSRPSDNGHTPFGDIWLSYSPDMKYWGEHRHVMSPAPFDQSAWQCTKVGAGSVPILTEQGWLMFFHGVITTCNGFRYSMGAALLDREDPSKVIYRSKPYLLAPAAPYELAGDVPNVVFPCAALTDGDRVAVYYGAADTSVCMAFGYISEIIEFIKNNSL